MVGGRPAEAWRTGGGTLIKTTAIFPGEETRYYTTTTFSRAISLYIYVSLVMRWPFLAISSYDLKH